MKIAITADNHLKTYKETPERYKAVVDIFEKCLSNGVDYLIMAGDVFDSTNSNDSKYGDFSRICKDHSNLNLIIFAGNHDPDLKQIFFTADNIEVIEKPLIKTFDGIQFLFIPYDGTKTMHTAISEFMGDKKIDSRWVLVGHSDYVSGGVTNGYDYGTYMPLFAKTISLYNFSKVFLGHIHKPSTIGSVLYPGSPYPLNINETDKRGFIVYDISTDRFERMPVETDVIYFDEEFLNFPVDNETDYIKKQIDDVIKGWDISGDNLKKVYMRISIKGFSKNLKELKNEVQKHLQSYGIKLYEDINLNNLKILSNPDDERILLLNKVMDKVKKLDMKKFLATRDDVIEKSMEIIFKV
ncbi:MAG: hypothetical protein GX445_02865 [Elusimicrobia bacterium]|nr:hypothetical protein [Elusimicrobiota bacterium]